MTARWTPGARKRERLHAQLRAEVQARRDRRQHQFDEVRHRELVRIYGLSIPQQDTGR
jgi:hypothetical protein